MSTIKSFVSVCIIYFLESGEGREKEREKPWLDCISHEPVLGTKPTAQACALAGNQTSDPSRCGTTLNQLSHTSQGWT